MCCVCVFFPFILDIKFVGRIPAGVTQEEGHTGFLIHLLSAVRAFIFLARRIQPFLSVVDCEVEFLCTNDFSPPPLGIFILFFSFLVRKIPFAGIELTSQRVSEGYEVPLSYRRDPRTLVPGSVQCSTIYIYLFIYLFFGCSDGMEREACVCDPGTRDRTYVRK